MSVDENMIQAFRKKICAAGFWVLDEKLKRDEMMNKHTSFRVGGAAQLSDGKSAEHALFPDGKRFEPGYFR